MTPQAARAAYARQAAACAAGDFAMPSRLASERLTFAPLGKAHRDALVRFYGDPESTRYIGGPRDEGRAERTLAFLCGHWLLRGFGLYAIADDSGEMVGYCGLHYPEGWPEIEIAYGLMPAARGKGYAAEAARRVREEAEARQIPSLVSYMDPRHLRSQHVAKRAGARHDGTITLRGGPATVMRHLPAVPGSAQP